MAGRFIAGSVLLAIVVGVGGCAQTSAPSPASNERIRDAVARFEHEWTRVAEGGPELRIQLHARPMAFFRFVNSTWTREVCAALADEIPRLPVARLHGDAHIEQYAVTADARGLDDFDDSSRGPAFVDATRFIASLELAVMQRGWQPSLPGVVDAFFDGYRTALQSPSYMPPDPAIVTRLRAKATMTDADFLAWADAMMEPMSAGDLRQVERSWPLVEEFALTTNPEATPAFLHRKAVGWLDMGIGSALTPKVLVRIEGPTPAPDDDLILEAKEVGPFVEGSCVSIPRDTEAARAVEGLRQIGRLPQRLLLSLPGVVGRRPDGRGWWVKAWDRTYVELGVADLGSADELREVARDVGVQLGSSNLLGPSRALADEQRRVELQAMARLEPRVRQVAHDLVVALTEAWRRGR